MSDPTSPPPKGTAVSARTPDGADAEDPRPAVPALVDAEASDVPAAAGGAAPPESAATRPGWLELALAFAIGLVACGLVYLSFTVPDNWFAIAQPRAWAARDLQVSRGVGRVDGDELYVMPSDPSGIVVVSVRTTFPSADIATVAWIATDVPDDVETSLLWRTDDKPEMLNTQPLAASSGRLRPAIVLGNPAWSGNIEGLGIAFRGRIGEPIRIRGVTVRPDDAREIVRERFRQWFAFEGWSGASINTVTGGAEQQDLPLPLLLAAAVAIATLLVAGIRRLRPGAFPLGIAGSLAVFVFLAWLLLDLRWTWSLARQVEVTAANFAFKPPDDKRLAADDGPLYAFVMKVREVLPREPARVFVVADSHYFRGRAAYHLSPHRVFFDPRANTIPAPQAMRPGDWLLVYQRKGIQYDPAQRRLRWDNLPPVAAELKLAGRGAALFQLL